MATLLDAGRHATHKHTAAVMCRPRTSLLVVGAGGTPGFGGQVRLLAILPHIAGGEEVAIPYDHPSFLRAIEVAFGISSHLNNAGAPTEHAMSDLFTR